LVNRYYDPATAQFLTVDALVTLTRSPYGYVGGNPLNGVDPTGLVNEVAGGGGESEAGYAEAVQGEGGADLGGARVGNASEGDPGPSVETTNDTEWTQGELDEVTQLALRHSGETEQHREMTIQDTEDPSLL
jgi:uncharacterized protein RhaS with RHS repeats